ncbi:MAG: MGMT family protein [Fervidicoccaceae archaeon]
MLIWTSRGVKRASTEDLEEALRALLQLIPLGRVTTYGDLAAALGLSPRAVGKMLARNREPIIVPCHRVIKANGSLGSYSFGGREKMKRRLLELEGVEFDERGRVPRAYFVRLELLLGSHRSTRGRRA